MGSLKQFRHINYGNIRGMEIDNSPWIVGVDAARALGYTNPRRAIRNFVDNEDKTIEVISTEGGRQELTLINEPGLYTLILNSRSKNSKPLKRWICNELLPELRETGRYIARKDINNNVNINNNEELIAKALLIADKTIKEKEEIINNQKLQIHEKNQHIESVNKKLDNVTKDIENKNRFISQVVGSKNTFKVRDIAQLSCKHGINIGQNRLFERMRQWGLICRVDNSPYQRFIEQGLFEIVEWPIETSVGTVMKRSLRVTNKGKVYIIQRLIKEDMEVSSTPLQ